MQTATQNITTSDAAALAPIKFLDPKTTPKRVRSHRSLEALIRGLKGKHATTVANELRLAFERYLVNGTFSFNWRVVDAVHGQKARRTLQKCLSNISEVKEGHRPSRQAKQRVFTLPGVKLSSKKGTTYNGRWEVEKEWIVYRMVDSRWMTERYEKWCQWCTENDIPQNLDIDGRTDWGHATLASMESMQVPTETASSAVENQQRLDKLTQTGVVRMVARKHGRMYTPVTNLCKVDRRRSTTDGQNTAEVDMHATYPTILTSRLAPEERGDLVEVLQRGEFYKDFQQVYEQFAIDKRAEMEAAGATEEQIAERLKGVKVEFQRACLFWRNPQPHPMRSHLRRRHPGLWRLILSLREQHGITGLSHMLTRAEGRLFVDTAIPTVFRECNVVGNHDGLIVPEDMTQRTKEILERLAYRQLGFVPGISIKTTATACR